MNWAIVIDGVVSRVSHEMPHSDAMPVRYDTPDASPVENEVVERDIADWIVEDDCVRATYAVMPRCIDAEREAAKSHARDEMNARLASNLTLTSLLSAACGDVDYEDDDGWRTLSQDDAAETARLVAQHSRACLAHCRDLHDRLDACASISEIREIDLTNSWPRRVMA